MKEIWFTERPFDVKDCDNVAFTVVSKQVNVDDFRHSEVFTLVIDLTQDLEKIWSGFSKKSCRYEIHRAERDGVKVQKSDNYHAFCVLNHSFRHMKRLGRTLSDAYIRKYGTLFIATIREQLLAGQVYIEDGNNIRWMIGASRRLESTNPLIGCANRALIWEAIKYAKSKRIKEFDFGGYYMGTAVKDALGVNFFKRSFGGEIVTRHIYQKNYSRLYGLAEEIYTGIKA